MYFQIAPAECISLPAPPGAPGQFAEQREDFDCTVDFQPDKTTPFTLKGTQPDTGNCSAQREATLQIGDEPGALVGSGVAVFKTANGDQLVAAVTWPVELQSNGGRVRQLEFHWPDSVQFSEGAVVASTGKFTDPDNRPRGLVVIAVMSGLLLPGVQY